MHLPSAGAAPAASARAFLKSLPCVIVAAATAVPQHVIAAFFYFAQFRSKQNVTTSPTCSIGRTIDVPGDKKVGKEDFAEGIESINAEMVFGPVPNREVHEKWMREAINMAELALRSDETPVGCVFVHKGEIIGRGINGTNASLNGTRHAEFVALAEIVSRHPPSILQQSDLYVTVEPCIMCASALRQFRVRAVYFGCLNDRFGGCGGVMQVHRDLSVDPPFPAYGGIFREEAIMLLRRFYVQENEKAPEPKPKKNRELKTEILPVSVSSKGGGAGGKGVGAKVAPALLMGKAAAVNGEAGGRAVKAAKDAEAMGAT